MCVSVYACMCVCNPHVYVCIILYELGMHVCLYAYVRVFVHVYTHECMKFAAGCSMLVCSMYAAFMLFVWKIFCMHLYVFMNVCQHTCVCTYECMHEVGEVGKPCQGERAVATQHDSATLWWSLLNSMLRYRGSAAAPRETCVRGWTCPVRSKVCG